MLLCLLLCPFFFLSRITNQIWLASSPTNQCPSGAEARLLSTNFVRLCLHRRGGLSRQLRGRPSRRVVVAVWLAKAQGPRATTWLLCIPAVAAVAAALALDEHLCLRLFRPLSRCPCPCPSPGPSPPLGPCCSPCQRRRPRGRRLPRPRSHRHPAARPTPRRTSRPARPAPRPPPPPARALSSGPARGSCGSCARAT